MSTLDEIAGRDAKVPWTAVLGAAEWTNEAAWTAMYDRRYLLGLVREARATVSDLIDLHEDEPDRPAVRVAAALLARLTEKP